MKTAEYLVVDSGGFITGAPLWELGQHVITLNEVINEIRDKATRLKLQTLPFDLEIRKPSTNALKAVTEFSKKTGDYASLSAVDLMVLAVTYDLEAEHCGVEHLAKEPKITKTLNFYNPAVGVPDGDKKIAGFFKPSNAKSDVHKNPEGDFSAFQFWREPIPDIPLDLGLDYPAQQPSSTQPFQCPLTVEELQNLDSFLEARSFICDFGLCQVDACVAGLLDAATAKQYNNILRWLNHIQSYGEIKQQKQNVSLEKIFAKIVDGFDFSIEDVVDETTSAGVAGEPISSDEGVGLNDSDKEYDDDEESEEDEDQVEENDEDGWITPSNIKHIKDNMQGGAEPRAIGLKVGCMTTDFAMQNVLKQMGLNIIGTNGRVIKETKTWILRCYACFKTCPELDRKFCPKCGNKTLKRVSVSIKEDGSQVIHISTRRLLTARGKKFSLPTHKGGKHAANPRLFEDQPEPQQRITKKARERNNPMDEDWIAGASPFMTKDVTSKSALLGLRGQGNGAKTTGHYWEQKNPNAARKSTGSKRKK
jgi:RNA-binding protein NOB1